MHSLPERSSLSIPYPFTQCFPLNRTALLDSIGGQGDTLQCRLVTAGNPLVLPCGKDVRMAACFGNIITYTSKASNMVATGHMATYSYLNLKKLKQKCNSSIMLTIFQVFTRHLWLVVTILNSTDCRTFPSSQKVLLFYVALSLRS